MVDETAALLNLYITEVWHDRLREALEDGWTYLRSMPPRATRFPSPASDTMLQSVFNSGEAAETKSFRRMIERLLIVRYMAMA